MPAPCPACAGTGCGQCAGSGVETLDLLRISDARMREIRGNRIAMIFQDPGKALNPGLTIRDQVAEVFFQRSEEHTSELQSLMRISYAVFCLKKKQTHTINNSDKSDITTTNNNSYIKN